MTPKQIAAMTVLRELAAHRASTRLLTSDDARAILAHIDALTAELAAAQAERAQIVAWANTLEAHLTEAIERVEAGDLDERMCCDGQMCGCYGSIKADHFLHFAKAAIEAGAHLTSADG